MAALSHQPHQSLIPDQTVFFPYTTTTTITTACSPQFHQSHDQASVANKLQSPDSSMSMVLDDHKLVESDVLAKKRKDKQMDASKKLKKQKKTNDYQEEKKKKTGIPEAEGAVGYIHVRARRGQATDSHSLAERVRREKISERMKLLQAIVPGCDKVTGKALMLDEIINYVQSLQNQVEFLSMKLASANPMLYDFGMDLDALMLNKPDHEDMSSMVLPILPSVQQCDLKGVGATFASTNDNYLINDSAATDPLLFQQAQMPNIISHGNGHQLWNVEEQKLKVDDPFALSNNLTSFQ